MTLVQEQLVMTARNSMSRSWRQIVHEVDAAPNLHESLVVLTQRVKDALPIDACAVYLTDVDNDGFVLSASEGLRARANESWEDRNGLIGWVAEQRELVLSADVAAHPRYRSSARGETRSGSFIGMPLIHYKQVLGVLAAWKEIHRPFDKDEVTFLVTIAEQLARSIHAAAAADEVQSMLNGTAQENAFIQGIGAASGMAIGTVAVLDPLADLQSIPDRQAEDREGEESTFRTAVAAVQRELSEAVDHLVPDLGKDDLRALFDVYKMLLGDDVLVSDTVNGIREGNWACGAWRHAVTHYARIFDEMEEPYLRARAEDIRHIGERVLVQLRAGVQEPRLFPERCILMGETLGIAEVAAVPAGRLAGIVCMRGSALSHMAILARALAIPAVVSLASLPSGQLDGSQMLIDGDEGRIYVRPSPKALEAFERRIHDEKAHSAALEALRDMPTETSDGVHLTLYANVGLAPDIVAAQRNGAEGIGLYRTEYMFLLREAFPVEDEQYQHYRALLEAFAAKPVTLRTLDAGGDKLLPYFSQEEDNPALGCRGIRFSLDHPEIFLIQLRAMLRANAGLDNLQVLFPMISTVGEVDEALGLLARAQRELVEEGQALTTPRIGVMIEVPAAVHLAAALAKRVDFLSVGTNDLTQYLLAVDRTNAQVTTPYDGMHPAVLAAIQHVVDAAHLQQKLVSVCGEMAGDPAGAVLLLGMGVDALSMSPSNLTRVKGTIRRFSLQRARELVGIALSMDDGFAIHRFMTGTLKEAELAARY